MANRDPKEPDTESSSERKRITDKLTGEGRDATLDADLERERLQPGQNSEGTGGVGADPAKPHEDSNSNT